MKQPGVYNAQIYFDGIFSALMTRISISAPPLLPVFRFLLSGDGLGWAHSHFH